MNGVWDSGYGRYLFAHVGPKRTPDWYVYGAIYSGANRSVYWSIHTERKDGVVYGYEHIPPLSECTDSGGSVERARDACVAFVASEVLRGNLVWKDP